MNSGAWPRAPSRGDEGISADIWRQRGLERTSSKSTTGGQSPGSTEIGPRPFRGDSGVKSTQPLGSNPLSTCDTVTREEAEQGCWSPVGSKGIWLCVLSKPELVSSQVCGTVLRGHSFPGDCQMGCWGGDSTASSLAVPSHAKCPEGLQ